MCHYIALGVASERKSLVEQVRREYGFRTWPNENPSISASFAPGLAVVLVTAGLGQCSCNFMPRAPGDPEKGLDAAARKYHRLGWSSSKIRRALAAKASARQSKPTRDADVRRFREFIRRLVEHAGVVHLLVHFFSGRLASERFHVGPGRTVSVSEYMADSWDYPEDVVVRVVREAA